MSDRFSRRILFLVDARSRAVADGQATPMGSQPTDLQTYEQIKFEMAERVRSRELIVTERENDPKKHHDVELAVARSPSSTGT